MTRNPQQWELYNEQVALLEHAYIDMANTIPVLQKSIRDKVQAMRAKRQSGISWVEGGFLSNFVKDPQNPTRGLMFNPADPTYDSNITTLLEYWKARLAKHVLRYPIQLLDMADVLGQQLEQIT